MPTRLAPGLVALCLALPAAAEGAPWTKQDTLWELSYAAVVAMDCSQSRQIQSTGREERNPLLPRHPSSKTIAQLSILNVAAHVGISTLLNRTWRVRFQRVSVAIEATVVADNYFRAGVRLNF